MSGNPIDFSTLTVSNAAGGIGFSSASPALATGKVSGYRVKGAVITVEDDQVRFRTDGTAPSSTEGHLLSVGDVLTFDSWTTGVNWIATLEKILFIRVTGDAKLKVSWSD